MDHYILKKIPFCAIILPVKIKGYVHMALWRKVVDNNTYSVSDDGQVRNDQTGRILKPCLNSCGYHYVQLTKNKKVSIALIHRLVCKAFNENEEGKLQVDHIDGNKTNNIASNLRWVSASENRKAYGYKARALHRMRSVLAVNDDGRKMTFPSRTAVGEYFQCSDSKVKYRYHYTKGSKKGWIFYKVEDIV